MNIKGVLFDVKNESCEAVEIGKSLNNYYEVLDCTTIDIVPRKIGGRDFLIICDDEGLYSSDPQISAIDILGQPQLVGNLFIVKFDGVDDVTSLNDDEIEFIKSKVVRMRTRQHMRGYPVLTEVEF